MRKERKSVDAGGILWYSCLTRLDFRSFFYAQKLEEEQMRTKITLACTECKQRNYNTTKDKKTHPDRMETKKYCRFCKTHTMHKETK